MARRHRLLKVVPEYYISGLYSDLENRCYFLVLPYVYLSNYIDIIQNNIIERRIELSLQLNYRLTKDLKEYSHLL
jgi:hypothetical protein